MRPITVPYVSIQGGGVIRRDGWLAGDDGDHRRIESEFYLLWIRRSDRGLVKNALSCVVWEGGLGRWI